MSKSSLVKKLHIKPGYRLKILNPPSGYIDKLGDLPEDVEIIGAATGKTDFVHLFVNSLSELNDLAPEAVKGLKYDGVFWVSYPKKSSKIKTDISRDYGWDLLMDMGLRPVAAVSIDETWSALRFRPVEKVKTK